MKDHEWLKNCKTFSMLVKWDLFTLAETRLRGKYNKKQEMKDDWCEHSKNGRGEKSRMVKTSAYS